MPLWLYRNQNLNSAGFSIFELMAAIAAMIPLLAGIVFLLHRTLKVDAQANRVAAEQRAELRIISLLQNGMAGLDYHRLAIWPKLHLNGQIKFADGSENEIVNSANFAPAPTSDAITFISISATNQYRVRSSFPGAARMNLRGCAASPLTPLPTGLNRFVGLTADSPYELIGEVSPVAGHPTCYDFLVEATKSMSLPTAANLTDVASVRIILPIVAHFTVYLDVKNRLRYLGHRGQENVENQPILDRAPHLKFSSEILEGRLILSLATHSSLNPTAAAHHYSFGHQLSRRDLFSLMGVR